MSEDPVQITAQISKKTFDTLVSLAAARGTDANTVLEQAVGTEKLFAENVHENDDVLIRKPDNTFSKVVFEK